MSIVDTLLSPLKKIFRKSFKKNKSRKKSFVSIQLKRKKIKKTPKRKIKPSQPIKKIKKVAAKKTKPPFSKELELGKITHYFSRISVVVIKMTRGELNIGEAIRIKGKTTDFIQRVKSLQIESTDVSKVHKGQLVGLKVDKQAKEGDKVYKVSR